MFNGFLEFQYAAAMRTRLMEDMGSRHGALLVGKRKRGRTVQQAVPIGPFKSTYRPAQRCNKSDTAVS